MASSAVYRYFASRDELLTALIIDAYDALGTAAEDAARRSRRRAPVKRWGAVASAMRTWALTNPHEYALLYGSPVPGYRAPEETTAPGTRASLALLSIVRDAAAVRELVPPSSVHAPGPLARELPRLRREVDLDIDDAALLATLLAWTQLFGLLSFEVFGQTRGLVTDHEALFDAASASMATGIGL